jgi:hypothetical protein
LEVAQCFLAVVTQPIDDSLSLKELGLPNGEFAAIDDRDNDPLRG